MAELSEELEAFKQISQGLHAWAAGKWVLIRDRRLIDLYNSVERATAVAQEKFGRGPYLIRQIQAR